MKHLGLIAILVLPCAASADLTGYRWALSECGAGCPKGTRCVDGRCAVEFRMAASVGNTGATTVNGGVSYDYVKARTEAAFAAWTSSRLNCPAVWNSVSAGTFSTPAGRAAVDINDRNNNIIWLSGSEWVHLPTEWALTTIGHLPGTNELIGADMEFNNNVTWSTTGAPNTIDIESVLLHEAGHFLGLDHSANAARVMYSSVTPGTTKRVLTLADQTDVCTAYPATDGAMGTDCLTDTECLSPLICRGSVAASTKICVAPCNDQTGCSSGYSCQNTGSDLACLPQLGASDMCQFCQSGAQCSTGLCLRFDTGVTFCSINCSASAQCGSGYSCLLPDGFCVPDAMTCTNQCTQNAECATGYTCTQGTCTPRGAPGDICTVSLFCQNCSVCTRESADSALSFCRPCCGGNGQGGFCNACADTACSDGSTCGQLSSGNSSVCVPGASQPLSCQPCNQGACADGLWCVGNRCRPDCNPQSPGTCPACFSLPTGLGVCACGDELAYEGEPCGQVASGLAACASGLECVGQTNRVCRAACEMNDPQSCPQGKTCQLIGGVNVCLPGADGSLCAACTNGGTCGANLTCYSGRCYEPCSVGQAGSCGTCVQTSASGAGVCGCEDQLSPEGGACGTVPGGVRACSTGVACINGVCGGVPTGAGGGNMGTGGGGGSPGHDGGSGGGGAGGPRNVGCGCSSAESASIATGLLLAFVTRRRRATVPK